MTAVETIGELFASPAAHDYLGEPVPIGEHMRQAGALAEAAGAEGALVAAALLHDIGHLLGDSTEDRHGEAGARWLSQWFGEAGGTQRHNGTQGSWYSLSQRSLAVARSGCSFLAGPGPVHVERVVGWGARCTWVRR